MFPKETPQNLSLLLNQFDNDIHGVVGELLESSTTNATFESVAEKLTDNHYVTINETTSTDPKTLLKNLAARIMKPEYTVDLQVDRSKMWRTTLGFYKTMIYTPEKLRYELRIDFIDEDGIDAGALK